MQKQLIQRKWTKVEKYGSVVAVVLGVLLERPQCADGSHIGVRLFER